MKTLTLAAFLSLSSIPGVFPEPPRICVRLGNNRRAAFLKWAHWNQGEEDDAHAHH